MNESQFQASKLQERYGVVKSVIYSRLYALGIKPQRRGHKSYISAEQLQLMDDLDAHLKAEGGTDEFVKQYIESGRINPAPAGEIVTQMIDATPQTVSKNSQAAPADAEEVVEHLLTQKDAGVNALDLQETHERAQYRAAAKVMGEETLTLLYEATEAFTIPGLKDQVEQHHSRIKQIRARRTKGIGHDLNDFLLKSLPVQMAAGTNGLSPSPNGSNATQNESNTNGSSSHSGKSDKPNGDNNS